VCILTEPKYKNFDKTKFNVLYQLYFDNNGLAKPADDDGKIDKVVS
jgi:hypothetical protein